MNDSLSTENLDKSPRAMPRRRWRRVAGIIVLVSLSLLLVIGCLYFGPVMQARESAQRVKCCCHLKQIGMALLAYHQEYGSFPPAITLGPDGQKWHSWRVLILPYLDQKELYAEYRFDEPWDGPNNRKLLEKMPGTFGCPSQPCPPKQAVVLSIGVLACTGGGPSTSSGFTSYSAVLGQDCAFPGTRPVSIDEITDGQTNTLLVGECTRTTIPWTKPDDVDIAFHSKLGDPAGFGSPHASGNGVNFGFADGRVEFLSMNLPQTAVDAMFTRNGGESVYGF